MTGLTFNTQQPTSRYSLPYLCLLELVHCLQACLLRATLLLHSPARIRCRRNPRTTSPAVSSSVKANTTTATATQAGLTSTSQLRMVPGRRASIPRHARNHMPTNAHIDVPAYPRSTAHSNVKYHKPRLKQSGGLTSHTCTQTQVNVIRWRFMSASTCSVCVQPSLEGFFTILYHSWSKFPAKGLWLLPCTNALECLTQMSAAETIRCFNWCTHPAASVTVTQPV